MAEPPEVYRFVVSTCTSSHKSVNPVPAPINDSSIALMYISFHPAVAALRTSIDGAVQTYAVAVAVPRAIGVFIVGFIGATQ